MSSGVTRSFRLAGFVVAPLVVVAVLAVGFDPVEWEGRQPLIHRHDEFVGSSACAACHPDQRASWSRTFHSTMTQRATPESVVGAFDGRRVSYEGKSAKPFRSESRFFMEVPGDDGATRTAEVLLAVGSRRYQQYFERVDQGDGSVFVRLPFLWHIGARRWMHMNTVFLGPDDPDWNQHRTRWNDNCIFCHNTGPKPGEIDVLADGVNGLRRFDSHVAELGISCESCHGPGLRHAERYRNVVRRYEESLDPHNDPSIVHPEKIDKRRAIAVCGQCHGQRMPPDADAVLTWFTDGPSFRSGELLEHHARPLAPDSLPPPWHRQDLFRLRFWRDGTPRLTAYEYQGVAGSPCFLRGTMTCSSCHTMHGGDPHGMVEPAMRTDAACLQCHEKIGEDLRAHTFHEPQSSGSRCMECHMPRMVYGILSIHRSHRIENPDPRRDGESGRPHACTTCHLNRSLAWSAEKMAGWWGPQWEPPRTRADGAPLELPDAVASILGGDAVQRAVYAWAAGRADSALEAQDKALVRAALIATLADAYPAVRWLARNSLLELERELPLGLEERLLAWDHTDGASRTETAWEMFDLLRSEAPGRLRPVADGGLLDPDFSPRMEAITLLLNLQDESVISIGE